MNLPSDTPRLPKWIFLLGDLILVAAAWLIYDGSKHPPTGGVLIAISICVATAIVVGVIPFVADYARKQDEALDNRQRSLQALSVTVAAAAEQISIAATGLQGIAEAAQQNLGKSEKVSAQIQEKMDELRGLLASAKRDDGEAAARLESVAKKIARTVAEFEAAASKASEAAMAPPAPPPVEAFIPEPPPVPLSRIVEIRPAALSSDSPFGKPAEPAPAPAAEPAPAAAPPRRRGPRKPPAPAEAPASAPVPEEQPAAEAAPPIPSAELSEPAVSADGATRLIVTAYIGIGNRLFIRGEGPGLSWEKGAPLSFVSIGKWRWETSEATGPVRFKLYKNDETECASLGERSVEPGAQQELSAAF